MAGVTYLIRMLPLAFFRKRITNPFLLGVLHYMPFAVLGTMTVPAIFTSTGEPVSAVAGFWPPCCWASNAVPSSR